MRKLLFPLVGLMTLASGAAYATPITGTLNLTGSGGVTFSGGVATFTDSGLGNVTFGNQTGSFSELASCANCVTFGSPASAGTTSFTYSSLPAGGEQIYSLIDGADSSSLTLTTITFAGVGSSGNYSIEGTGTLTLTGFDPTTGTFDLTAQGNTANASFSATSIATAVPEPASLALVGAGLFGMGLVRKRRTRA